MPLLRFTQRSEFLCPLIAISKVLIWNFFPHLPLPSPEKYSNTFYHYKLCFLRHLSIPILKVCRCLPRKFSSPNFLPRVLVPSSRGLYRLRAAGIPAAVSPVHYARHRLRLRGLAQYVPVVPPHLLASCARVIPGGFDTLQTPNFPFPQLLGETQYRVSRLSSTS